MKTIESKLVLEFQNAGFNFFSGVPCGMIKPLLNELEKTVSNKNFCYLPREDICLGVACGAYLAGMKPVVLMQNSGLGHSINALASLIIPFKIPITLIVSVRGFNGLDSEENKMMGNITESILDLLNVPHKIISNDNYVETIKWASNLNIQNNLSVLLVTPDLFNWSSKL